jgi:hypothetical protein
MCSLAVVAGPLAALGSDRVAIAAVPSSLSLQEPAAAHRLPAPSALPFAALPLPGDPPGDAGPGEAGTTTAAPPPPAAEARAAEALAPAPAPPASHPEDAPLSVPIPPPAAPPEPPPPPPTWQERRGAQALAFVDYPWQATGFQISFHPARRGYRGMTDLGARRIEVYVRPGESIRALAFTVAHEIAHAVDVTFGSSARRRAWRQLRGLDPHLPWFSCDGCSDFATPAGDYAETFAYWLVGPAGYRSRLAPPPSAAELELLAPLFRPGP